MVSEDDMNNEEGREELSCVIFRSSIKVCMRKYPQGATGGKQD